MRWGGQDEGGKDEGLNVGPRKPELVTDSNAIHRDEALTYLTEQVCFPCRDLGQKGITVGWQGA